MTELPCEDAPPDPLPLGKRKHQRFAFAKVQRVAFGSWGRIPTPSDFRTARFHDLSASGCAFVVAVPPTESEVLIELWKEATAIYVQAQIVRVSPFQRGQQLAFLVGCKFLSRLPGAEEI